MANIQRQRATSELLLKKRPVEKEVVLNVQGEDGNPEELTMLFRAISHRDYDDLMAKHKPTANQQKDGYAYNPDTFGPALVARVCVDPALSEEDAKAIWDSDEWNRGEISTLFSAAVDVCMRGADIPFTESG